VRGSYLHLIIIIVIIIIIYYYNYYYCYYYYYHQFITIISYFIFHRNVKRPIHLTLGQCICEVSYTVQRLNVPILPTFVQILVFLPFFCPKFNFLFSHLAFPLFCFMSCMYFCSFCHSFPLRSAKLVPCNGR